VNVIIQILKEASNRIVSEQHVEFRAVAFTTSKRVIGFRLAIESIGDLSQGDLAV